MKLTKWAKEQGVTYRTAWQWFKDKQIPTAYKTPSGTIIVPDNKSLYQEERIAVYCRVSSQSRKDEMEYQVERCCNFCMSRGVKVSKVFKEVASGMNDKRRELLKMLEYRPTMIVVENKDRLTRFGFNYLEVLLKRNGCTILIMNEDHEDEHDLIKDMVSLMTSFCCRLYGLRRGQNKGKRIKEVILE